MNTFRSVSRRLLLGSTLIFTGIGAALAFGIQRPELQSLIFELSESGIQPSELAGQWGLAAGAGGGFAVGLITWGFLSLLSKSPVKALEAKAAAKPAPKGKRDPKLEMIRNKKTFLHLVSALQNEGRLLDFFAENLDLYEDDQIGAAVRTIHGDCKKTLSTYIDLETVLDMEEGSDHEVAEGFDPNRIKLTGNVSGKPPFTGTVRHKGWKAAKVRLPKFSDTDDADILAPAEVEIEG